MRLIFLLVLLSLPGCASEKTVLQIAPEQEVELVKTPFFPQEKYQCGPASLATLLSASGATSHPEDLAPHTYLPGRLGSLQLELIAASRQNNRIPYVIDPDILALIAELRAGRPVLVLQNLGLKILPVYHYAVVIGLLQDDKIVLRSGTNPRLVMDLFLFLETWRRSGSWGMIVLRPGALPARPDPVRYLRAVSAFEVSGNILQAAHGYIAAHAFWPENQMAMFALGNNYLHQSKYRDAAAVFRKLLMVNPEHVAAANNLAETLARRGCYAQASTVINQAVKVAESLNSPFKKTVLQTRQEISQYLEQTSPVYTRECADELKINNPLEFMP